MARQTPVTTDALRERFATGPIARAGWSFEAAMQIPAIATALECGAREAARATQINRARPHWQAEREP